MKFRKTAGCMVYLIAIFFCVCALIALWGCSDDNPVSNQTVKYGISVDINYYKDGRVYNEVLECNRIVNNGDSTVYYNSALRVFAVKTDSIVNYECNDK